MSAFKFQVNVFNVQVPVLFVTQVAVAEHMQYVSTFMLPAFLKAFGYIL